MIGLAAMARSRTDGVPRGWLMLGLLCLVGVLWVLFNGQYTIPHDDDAATFHRINDAREWIDSNRNSNPIFLIFVGGVRTMLNAVYGLFLAVFQGLTWPGLPTPELGGGEPDLVALGQGRRSNARVVGSL